MKKLTMYDNLLTGPIPDSIEDMVSLIEVRLQHNQLTGPVPRGIAELPQLDFVAISRNQLTGENPIVFLGHLMHLFLDRNNFD